VGSRRDEYRILDWLGHRFLLFAYYQDLFCLYQFPVSSLGFFKLSKLSELSELS